MLLSRVKRLLGKKSRSEEGSVDGVGAAIAPFPHALHHRHVLPPNPTPYERLQVIVSSNGLLLRPDTEATRTHVRIRFDKDAALEQVDGDIPEDARTNSAFVFGIVGIMKLFHSAIFR